jgi:Ca2+-transporting ATPase
LNQNQPFYSQKKEELFRKFETSEKGFSDQEAQKRLAQFGPNILLEAKKFSTFTLFLHQFKNPLIYILFVALIISFATAHLVDAGIILVVILISSIVGFLQEYRADRALARLKEMVRHKAKVLRDGQEIVIGTEGVVPGDIIVLTSGDKVPADARLIQVQNFEVIEAALTGESVPSSKHIEILAGDTPLADRENMVYLGTVVARGTARALVVATAQHTELSRIARMVKETEEAPTPLQRQLTHFGKLIGLILVAINALIFFLGILTGKPLFEMFLTSVAVVVAAVPEGLLPAMTVILAIGMQRLAKRKGLVRKMLAAETLGSVSVISADKTGTLTQGEMRVSQIITETAKISHDGESFSQTIQPDGETSHIIALKTGLLCNNAVIENPDSELKDWVIEGDPTEKALLLAGRAAGLEKDGLEKKEPRLAEIPFDSEYKFMATLHRVEGAQTERFSVYAKGAPEKILDLSSYVDVEGKRVGLTTAKRRQIQKQYEDLTGSGLRVLAMAYKLESGFNADREFTREKLGDLIFIGLVAIKDPLRSEAKEAITLCQEAGIRPVIVTGDHKLTATAIVRELGIEVGEENVLVGADLDKLTDEELDKLIKKIVIFARVEPRHKIRIVSALQINGEVVAMTGDGVNDTPALKQSDIGVVVGSGTDVAKETADLVLLDDNFRTIVEAVRRGRITFNNIRKVVLYLLTDSFSEVVVVGGSVILGLPLPILPAQILWIKMIEDTSPAMSLSFDEIDENVMKDRPRKKMEPLLNHQFKALIVFYAVIMDLILFGLFYYFWKTSGDIDFARTITFVGLGFTSLFYIYAVRGLKLSIFKLNPFSNRFLTAATIVGILLLLIAIYTPFFNNILHTVPLGIKEWAVLASYAALSIVVYEIGKKLTIAKN